MPATLRDERGFSLIEAVVACTLLALLGTAFGVTTGNGFGLIGTSQERQSAVQIANQWMEEARVVPVDGLALPADTVFDGPGTPDEDVALGTTYTSAAGAEELVLDAGSTFAHRGQEEMNGVDFDVYRYVTWVVDGADTQAYKRVTVVVQWTGTGGEVQRVTQSTLMSGDGIAWASGTSTTTTALAATTTSSSTTSTTATTVASTSCTGDTAGPSATLAILAGTGAQSGYTSSATVTLSMTAVDACASVEMGFSNDGSTWSPWVTFTASAVWSLPTGNGSRTMYARFRDGNGNLTTRSASVIVDGTAPTTPGSFTATVLNGPKRVRLTWTQSSDNQSVIGYRIYRRHGSGSFQNQSTGVSHPCSTSPCQWTDSGVQNNNTYTYYVVAYDAAGNESAPTAQLTRTI